MSYINFAIAKNTVALANMFKTFSFIHTARQHYGDTVITPDDSRLNVDSTFTTLTCETAVYDQMTNILHITNGLIISYIYMRYATLSDRWAYI
eukprot:scaffold330369_cov19-Prasinocladus_malaysianus.AAC.1